MFFYYDFYRFFSLSSASDSSMLEFVRYTNFVIIIIIISSSVSQNLRNSTQDFLQGFPKVVGFYFLVLLR